MVKEVLTIGSATIDTFIDFKKRTKDVKPGDKVLVENLEKYTGGSSNNSATALKRMGLKVKAVFKIGEDHDGDLICKKLKKEGVKCLEARDGEKRTSFSAILHSLKEKDRIIYTYKGASDNLLWEDINKKDLENVDCVYMGTLLKKSFKTAIKLAKYTKKKDIKLLFNPSSYLAEKGLKKLKPILEATDILVLNKSEAEKLLKEKGSIKKLIKKLKKRIKEVIIITEGAKGVHAYDGEIFYSVRPFKVKVVHTAGAGDSFTSGFLASYLREGDIGKALKIGNANSASVIQHYGTTHRLLTYKEAEDFIKKHEVKVKKGELK